MAKSVEPTMEENAANEGDKLKHSILLEVLRRCREWTSLTYAETHAGAGLYDVSDQTKKPHISDLQQLVVGLPNALSEESAGATYYSLLKRWWSDELNDALYPGSVLQAALFLEKTAPATFRVVEAKKETHDKLVRTLKKFDIDPLHGTFQANIEWLTQNNPLVLLVDPFSFQADFGKNAENKLNQGGIDLPRLRGLFNACFCSNSAVIILWCSFGHKGGHVKKGTVYGWLRGICEERGATLRCFHHKHYVTFIVGIGNGRDIAMDLPMKDAWSKSWLTSTVRAGFRNSSE